MNTQTEAAGGAAAREAESARRKLRTAMLHLTIALAVFAGTIAARWVFRH
jgi:hypothetical protein